MTRIQDLLKSVRRIRIRSKKAVDSFMAGQFRSVFKGSGIEFEDVRPYLPGDDVRSIDWKVTARTGHLHTRTYEEDREQNVILLVDKSASHLFGSKERSKWDSGLQLCAQLCFSALFNNNRVGLILCSHGVDLHIPPRKGLDHGMVVLRDLIAFSPKSRPDPGSPLRAGLDFLMKISKRRAIVFVVSDFLTQGYESVLGPAAKRHEIIGVQLFDPRERELKGKGVIRLRDLETDQVHAIDLGRRAVRKAYAEAADERMKRLKKTFRSKGAELLEIEAGISCAKQLRRFFLNRMIRRA